jgi:hypothetical protein
MVRNNFRKTFGSARASWYCAVACRIAFQRTAV